jgi:hypothetical protein
MARLMSDMLTLRAALAAARAKALMSTPGAARGEVAPTLAEVATALAAMGSQELTPGKLALLHASLTSFDAHTAALRLTPSSAQRLLNPGARKPRAKAALGDALGILTAVGLDTMTFGSWAECMRWLAERAGYVVEETPLLTRDTLLAWRGRRGGATGEKVIICARRLEEGAPLLAEDMWRLATIAVSESGARLVALTTAEATVGAQLVARDIRAELIDRGELDLSLAKLATAFTREREQSRRDAKAQAKAASAARKKLIAALTTAGTQAKATLSAQRATGRAAVRKAVEQVRDAHRTAVQALMAWETLAGEWLATFGERPARDGSLPMLAEPHVWTELGARADHLKKPLLDALRAMNKSPGDGDLDYGAWRQALGEELAARCAALLWRVSMVEPTQAQDYASAVNDLALREASRADNAATHAAARAARAQSQMAVAGVT